MFFPQYFGWTKYWAFKLDTGCAKVMKLLSSRFLTKMIDELYFDKIVHGNMIWTYLCLSSCGCDGVHMRCSSNLQLLLGKGEYQEKNTFSEKISGKKEHLYFLTDLTCAIFLWEYVPAGNPWLLLALLCVHLVKTSPLLRGLEQTTVEDLKYQKNHPGHRWLKTNNRFYSKYQKYHPGHRWEGSGREWKSGLQPET